MELIPAGKTIEENQAFADHPDCRESLSPAIEHFNRVGYVPPWIGYFAKVGDNLVGSAGFVGAPKEGKVEIAYGTFPAYQNQGIGSQICHQLVTLALTTDPTLHITANTLPEGNFSTKILQKNGFERNGTAWDDDEGEVWAWEYRAGSE